MAAILFRNNGVVNHLLLQEHDVEPWDNDKLLRLTTFEIEPVFLACESSLKDGKVVVAEAPSINYKGHVAGYALQIPGWKDRWAFLKEDKPGGNVTLPHATASFRTKDKLVPSKLRCVLLRDAKEMARLGMQPSLEQCQEASHRRHGPISPPGEQRPSESDRERTRRRDARGQDSDDDSSVAFIDVLNDIHSTDNQDNDFGPSGSDASPPARASKRVSRAAAPRNQAPATTQRKNASAPHEKAPSMAARRSGRAPAPLNWRAAAAPHKSAMARQLSAAKTRKIAASNRAVGSRATLRDESPQSGQRDTQDESADGMEESSDESSDTSSVTGKTLEEINEENEAMEAELERIELLEAIKRNRELRRQLGGKSDKGARKLA